MFVVIGFILIVVWVSIESMFLGRLMGNDIKNRNKMFKKIIPKTNKEIYSRLIGATNNEI